jgi:hypothetical protein
MTASRAKPGSTSSDRRHPHARSAGGLPRRSTPEIELQQLLAILHAKVRDQIACHSDAADWTGDQSEED